MKCGNFINSLLTNLIPPKTRNWPKILFGNLGSKAISLLVLDGFPGGGGTS